MLRKPRRIVAATITAFWLVMVAFFLYREGWLSPAPALRETTRVFQPRDQWMGIYLEGGQQVGRLHMTSREAARGAIPGFLFDLDAELETSLFGLTTRMDLGGNAWSSEKGDRSEFDFALTSGDHTMAIKGVVAEKRLRATLQTGGEAIPLDFPLEHGFLSDAGMGLAGTGLPPLKPGESTVVAAFDPTTMKMGDATITCLREETIPIAGAPVPARVYATTIGSLTSKAWIGEGEEVLQATTPFGFTLRKIAPETARLPLEPGSGGDLIQSLAIIPGGPPAFEHARSLRVRITGVDLESLPHDPPWQLRDGDMLTMTQSPPVTEASQAEPPTFDTAPFLASDAFVTAGHPRIQAQAAAIVGEEKNPAKQALLLHDWLFEHIEKVPVLSVPNALDVLRTRTGDCNEHAVLFTALARALGIPTRIAIGLVYSDTLGGFGYHAWPEVYYDGWHSMDPTLGQLAADATHIKLLNGSIEAWVRLAAYIGQIRMEIISIE